MAESIGSSRPVRRMRHEGLALVAVAWLGCAPSHSVSDEANPLPGLTVTDDKVEQQLIQSDVVFAGDVIDFYRSPPPVEPHGDYFAPVTFRVLRVFTSSSRETA
jgi:hypothetical protein